MCLCEMSEYLHRREEYECVTDVCVILSIIYSAYIYISRISLIHFTYIRDIRGTKLRYTSRARSARLRGTDEIEFGPNSHIGKRQPG